MRVLIPVGTRPEIIKAKPIVKLLRQRGHQPILFATSQNPAAVQKEMLAEYVADFESAYPKGLLSALTVVENEIGDILKESGSRVVLAIGDTTSALAATIAGKRLEIPVVHLESGMRTNQLTSPFPEELFRRIIDLNANIHLCVHTHDSQNLKKEIFSKNIHIINHPLYDLIESYEFKSLTVENISLIHLHRRELTEEKYIEILSNISEKISEYSKILVVQNRRFADVKLKHTSPKLTFVEPLRHVDFVKLLSRCRIVVSDSGGLQEECYALNVPHLIARASTERPYLVKSSRSYLVGTEGHFISMASDEVCKHFSYELGHIRSRVPGLTGGSSTVVDIISSI